MSKFTTRILVHAKPSKKVLNLITYKRIVEYTPLLMLLEPHKIRILNTRARKKNPHAKKTMLGGAKHISKYIIC